LWICIHNWTLDIRCILYLENIFMTYFLLLSSFQFIGHNEDALNAMINHFYIVSAHIKPCSEEGGGIFPIREEKWEAMTYAGSLPGYASGHNYHGLVFSVNTIFTKKLHINKIREFNYTLTLIPRWCTIID